MNKRDGTRSPDENMAPSSSNKIEEHDERPPSKRAKITQKDDFMCVAGRVASVKLQNFMCHANLLIQFNTEKNNCFYIGGPNGSGKSALFAAINLGLGGKGSDNDRGSTVKSYIKDGTTQAKVTITLTNTGMNCHPDYGELISVERTINQTSSTYVMKSIRVAPNGEFKEEVISKKKADIDRIICRFNIHLSNPAFWMSQDRSRSFLANFKPANVYKLYLESTNLENIRLSYMRLASALQDCRSTVNRKHEEIMNENRKLKRMQEQRALQEQLAKDRHLLAVYKWKTLFCGIRDLEDSLVITLKKQALQKEHHARSKLEYAENRKAREAVEKKGQVLADEVKVQQLEVNEVNSDLEETKKELSKFEEKMADAENAMKKKRYEITHTKRSIAEAQAEVKLIMEKQGSTHLNKQLADIERRLALVSKEREEMELGGDADRLREQYETSISDLKKAEENRYEVKSQISRLQRKVEENTATLRRAREMKQNTINKYGPSMAEILHEINRCKSQFREVPKGPLGKYITLIEPKWSYPVEEAIRTFAGQFLCSNTGDAKLLRKIFEKLRLSNADTPNIIVSRFLGAAHSNLREPSSDFPTLYRVLKFTDPDVHNAIIDKTNCESIILLEEKTQAMDIMCDNPPRNATKAYLLDGSQAYAGGSAGQYRFYAGKPGRARGIFGTEQETVDEVALSREIDFGKKELHQLESQDLRRYDNECNDAKKAEYNCKMSIERFEKKLASLRSEEIKLERTEKDLKRKVAEEASEDRLDSLNEGIEEQEKKIPKIEESCIEIQKTIEALKQEMAPIRKKKMEAEKMLSQMHNEVKDYTARGAKLVKELARFDDAGDVLKARVDKLRADEAVLYHDEAKIKTHIDEAKESVQQMKKDYSMPEGEKDPPDLSNFPPTEKAKKKLDELERAVNKTSLGCDLSITNDYVKDFKDKLKMYRYQCRQIDACLDRLCHVQAARLKLYPTLKKYTEMKVCEKFKELLDVRGHFIGGLEFDHEKETLNVNVQSCKDKDPLSQLPIEEDEGQEDEEDEEDDDEDEPRRKKTKKQQQKKKKKARDLKGLSGGERSFVTAALVMSLWEVMEQPFRMMDEFDVFMDMMNRKLVMDLLVELATKKFPHNQFIFFTPQGIKELNKVDGLQIFEMNKVRD